MMNGVWIPFTSAPALPKSGLHFSTLRSDLTSTNNWLPSLKKTQKQGV
jgi:hypothetical protein